MPAAEEPDGKRELLGFPHLAPGGRPRLPRRLLRPRPARLPHLPVRPADPRSRRRPERARRVYTGDDVRDGQKVFLEHGLMEYGSIFGHGAYLGPDFTADYLHRSSRIGPRSARRQRAPTPRASETIDQFQTNRYDSDTEDAAAHRPSRRARSGSCERHYRDVLRQPDHSIRAAPEADRRPAADPSADRLLRLVGLGGVDPPPRPQLLLHQQLAARGAGRQHAERRRARLVGGLADRAARRHRDPVRGLRTLEARLAGPRAGDAQLPLARRRRADPRPAGHCLVLLRDGGAVPAPDPGRRRLAALPRRARRLLRHRHRPGVPLQPGPHLARAAGDLLRLHLVRRRRHLPGADDRRPRAARPEQARLRPARSAGGGGLRQPDRRVRRHPQLVPGLDLRRPGLRVPRPGALLAGPAGHRALPVDRDPLPRPARQAAKGAGGEHALAVLPRRAGDPRLLRGRAAGQRQRAASRSPTTGASGSSTSGWRTSWSCSPPRWSPTSSCCSGWCASGWRCW